MHEEHDNTEVIRRVITEELNGNPRDRAELEECYGEVWDTHELQEHFRVLGFLAPFCRVIRLSDNAEGSLMFQHMPRFYFLFGEHKK